MGHFQFKQFGVDQAGCAMKINTDGVLLAAMAEQRDPLRILDIGTGTGVIALMLAQRFDHAEVAAVEIDEAAAATAKRNFAGSIFAERLQVEAIDIASYRPVNGFDLIVSNPPFFVNDLRNVEEKKGIARHADMLFFETLVAKVASLLTADGSFWFILPLKQAEFVVEWAKAFSLAVERTIYLHSDERKPAFRAIVCLKRKVSVARVERFYIYESERVYTSAYKELLKDFFLGY